MSLTGLLDTVGLADVLTLLATTAKTGVLRITGPDGGGQVWLKDGRLIASDDGHGAEHPEAVFRLIGVTSGTFSFEEGREAPEPGRPFEVAPLLVLAAERRREWDEIRAVIPSNQALACMAPAAAHGHMIVSSLQWSILAAIAGGRSVGDLIGAVRQREFEGSRLLKEMVEARLIDVTEPMIGVEPTASPQPAGGPRLVDPGRPAAATVTAPTVSPPTPTPGRVVSLPVAAFAPPVVLAPVDRTPAPSPPLAEEPAEPPASADQSPAARNWMTDLVMSAASSGAEPAAHGSGGGAAALVDGSQSVLTDDESSQADAAGLEPINRGLLLKFLSSVRS